MAKKHKVKESPKKESKPNFLDIHWQKIIVIALFLLPFFYFAQFLSPNTMIAGSDYLIGGYPFEKWSAQQKEMPLWYPHVFGGIPVLGQPVGGPLAPIAQLKAILPPQIVLTMSFIIFFFIAGLGMYLYLKDIGLSKYSAAIGAFIYQFIGNLATTPMAGHAGRAASIATFPLMLFFLHHALKTKKLLYFILLSLATAFAFYEGHFQITYYGLLFILGYLIYYLITHRKESSKKDWLKIFGYGFLAIILIFLLMAMVWLPVLGGLKTAARGVERGYEYATSWALPPIELIDLLVPTFSGIHDNYWGTNPFKQHTEYFGLLPIIFAVFAVILYWKKPYIKFYFASAIIVILVAIGDATPFFKIFYYLIPGFKLMRAPSLIFYLASFSFITLACIGFENIIIKREINQKKFLVAAVTFLAFFILVMIITSAGAQSLAGPKISVYEQNTGQFTQGIFLAVVLFFLIFGMIFFAIKQKLNALSASLAAIILSLISQVPLMAKFLPKGPGPETYYAPDDVVRFLKKDQDILRVFPFQYGKRGEHDRDCYLLYHNIQSAGGYIPNPIQRYQDFIGAGTSVMFNPLNLIQYPKFVDILNLKYIIAPNLPEDLSQYTPDMQRYIIMIKNFLARFGPVFRGYQYSVYQNDSVLPRAYIVPDYRVVKENEVLEVLKLGSYEPKEIVILEENPNVEHSKNKFPMVEAKILEYSPNKIVCETDCPYAGFLVLTDNWHPDWQVLINDEKSKLYRANYTFRAVSIPAGKNEVIFAYKSFYFSLGNVITILGIVLIIAFFIPRVLWWLVIKSNRLFKKTG